jgi:hypothetical protein
MSTASKALKTELERTKQSLKLVRDEVLLKLHLGSMDARDTWQKLNQELQRVSHEVTESSVQALRELDRKLRDLSASIESGRKQEPGTQA